MSPHELPRHHEKPRSTALVDWILIGIAVTIIVAIPKSISGDGRLRYESLEQFMETGRLVSPKYSTVGPLLSVPLYWLGRGLGAAKAVTSYYNALIYLVFLPLLWREFKDELSPILRRNILFLLVFASMFPLHVQRYYGEIFTTTLVVLGVFWLSRGHWLRGWLVIALGALNTPASVIGIAGIALCHARQTRRWWPMLAPPAIFGLMRLESFLVRGRLLNTGYNYDAGFYNALPYAGLPNFSYPFFFGILALFLSFGKGLVFFTPGLFFPLPASAPPRFRWVHYTLVTYTLGLVLAYAKWWSWYGGWFWGPRFFLVASIPASFTLAAHLAEFTTVLPLKRLLVAVALLLSFWVGVNGLAFQNLGLDLCTKDFFALEAFCHFVPEMSPLWHPFVDEAQSLPPTLRVLAFTAVGFWALAALWTGREIYPNLVRLGVGKLIRWRDWW